ncbi:tyrosine-type recombinase/integrase [Methanoregula sp.]|uniref:tyrosine-type recombinase/integrase n=1 Tax=Methanoregula sp. TaxID=2052170 RepID=UPI0035618C86
MSEYLDKLPLLSDANRAILKSYVRKQEIKQLQVASIQDKVWRVYYLLKFLNGKDARQITKADLEDYIIYRRKTVSPRTLQGDMIELHIFFRFIDPAKEKEFFPADEKMQKPKIEFPDPLTRDDIQKLIRACDTLRDRALIMFLWDTGCRVSEALDLNVGDIHFEQSCGNARLRGKTGDREAWLLDCLPDLQAWINAHPRNMDPESPLFVTYTRYGFGSRRLDIRTVQNLCKTLQKRGEVNKRVHPHGFRHARATDKAREGYTEMELRIMFGWSKSSNMPATYIHLSGADVKQKILQKAGLIEQPAQAGDRPLDPVKCPRCGMINTGDSVYCKSCSMGLRDEVRRRMMSLHQRIQASPDYQAIKERMEPG